MARIVSRQMTLLERLAFYSTPGPNGCIHWTANHNEKGYGQLDWMGRTQRAHRLMWEAVRGRVPNGMCVLHACDNPGCINIDHLWLGTQLDNIADRERKRRGVTPNNEGERNGGATLTERQVREIRASAEGSDALAARYGITQGAIYGIRARRTWKHVKEN